MMSTCGHDWARRRASSRRVEPCDATRQCATLRCSSCCVVVPRGVGLRGAKGGVAVLQLTACSVPGETCVGGVLRDGCNSECCCEHCEANFGLIEQPETRVSFHATIRGLKLQLSQQNEQNAILLQRLNEARADLKTVTSG